VTITLTASGTPANLSEFLHRLQNIQSRAVLIKSLSLGGSDPSHVEATVAIDTFCRKSDTCKAAS
jgi:hypothetical protein